MKVRGSVHARRKNTAAEAPGGNKKSQSSGGLLGRRSLHGTQEREGETYRVMRAKGLKRPLCIQFVVGGSRYPNCFHVGPIHLWLSQTLQSGSPHCRPLSPLLLLLLVGPLISHPSDLMRHQKSRNPGSYLKLCQAGDALLFSSSLSSLKGTFSSQRCPGTPTVSPWHCEICSPHILHPQAWRTATSRLCAHR